MFILANLNGGHLVVVVVWLFVSPGDIAQLVSPEPCSEAVLTFNKMNSVPSFG